MLEGIKGILGGFVYYAKFLFAIPVLLFCPADATTEELNAIVDTAWNVFLIILAIFILYGHLTYILKGRKDGTILKRILKLIFLDLFAITIGAIWGAISGKKRKK